MEVSFEISCSDEKKYIFSFKSEYHDDLSCNIGV